MKPAKIHSTSTLILVSILLLISVFSCRESSIVESELPNHSSSSPFFDSLHLNRKVFHIDSLLLNEEFKAVQGYLPWVGPALDSLNALESAYVQQVFGLFLSWAGAKSWGKDLLDKKIPGNSEQKQMDYVLRGIRKLNQAYLVSDSNNHEAISHLDSALYFFRTSEMPESPYLSFLYNCGAKLCEDISQMKRNLAWNRARADCLRDSIAPVNLRIMVNTIVMNKEGILGSPTRALDLGNRNLDLFNQHQVSDSTLIFECWEELAFSHAYLKELSKSKEFAAKVENYFSTKPEEHDRFIQFLRDYGTVLAHVETREAFELSLQKVKYAMQLVPDLGSDQRQALLKTLAYTYKDFGDHEKSRKSFVDALSLSNDSTPTSMKADLMAGLAELYIYRFDKEDGIKLNREATRLLAGRSFSDPDGLFEPIDIIQDVSLPYLLEDFGMYHIKKYNANPSLFESSYDTVMRVFDLLDEALKIDMIGMYEADRIIDLKFLHQVYSKPIRFLAGIFSLTGEDEYLEKAFDFMEKSRANILLGNTSMELMARKYSVPDSLVARGRDLNARDRKLASARASQKRSLNSALNKEIENYEQSKNQYLELLEHEYPEFYGFYFSPPRISVSSLQSSLSNHNAAVMEFQMRDSMITIACINGQQKELFNQKFDENDREVLARYSALISKSPDLRRRKELQTQMKQDGYHLYQKLLQPFEDIWTEQQMLYIIPDGPLHSIPFGALLVDTATRSDEYFDLNYVQKIQHISYAQSATSLVQSFDLARNHEKEKIAVFAYSNEETLVQTAGMSELKGSFSELKSIRKIYRRNGKYISGYKVSKQEVFDSFDQFDILHFAIHAKSHPADINSSQIVFRNDQTMTATEIYGRQIIADLVVLSACESGMGKQIIGEGVFHLARPFLMAGANSVITNRWRLPDHIPAKLMANFYSDYRKGINAEVSLSKAKNSFIEENRQFLFPFYWGGMNSTH